MSILEFTRIAAVPELVKVTPELRAEINAEVTIDVRRALNEIAL